jgi:hypothetical protein
MTMIRVGIPDETTTIHDGTDDDMMMMIHVGTIDEMMIGVVRRSAESLLTATMPEMVGGMDEVPTAAALAIVPGETAIVATTTTGNVGDDVTARITHASTISNLVHQQAVSLL